MNPNAPVDILLALYSLSHRSYFFRVCGKFTYEVPKTNMPPENFPSRDIPLGLGLQHI